MPKLCAICSEGGKWLPTPINTLDAYLQKLIPKGTRVIPSARALRKNIAYNLQSLQYIDQTLKELNLTDVLVIQSWKVFILVGTGIIEALLYYLLRSNALQKKREWELIITKQTNEFKLDGLLHKIESSLLVKLETPQDDAMSIESMIQKAEDKKLLGKDHEIYKKLQHLRKLRNRVHLFLIDDEGDTDWTRFKKSDFTSMKHALYVILTSKHFSPKASEKRMFSFLNSSSDA